MATQDLTSAGTPTFASVVAPGGIKIDSTNTLATKIIDIGQWDMDATQSVDVPHGLSNKQSIRSVNVFIRDDATNVFNKLDRRSEDGYLGQITDTNIPLFRTASGTWDNVLYDQTSFNLDNAAAVDKGSGLVGIPITNNKFSALDTTTISGTTNYDGTYSIVSKTTNEIVIAHAYVSETFAGTETASWSRGWVTITYVA